MQSATYATDLRGSRGGEQQQKVSISEPVSRQNNRYLLKLGALVLVIAACLPFIYEAYQADAGATPSFGVDGMAVPRERTAVMEADTASLSRRADSPTDVCTRFSHQSAIINGTLYIYGGQATTEAGQESNKWSKTWQMSH